MSISNNPRPTKQNHGPAKPRTGSIPSGKKLPYKGDYLINADKLPKTPAKQNPRRS